MTEKTKEMILRTKRFNKKVALIAWVDSKGVTNWEDWDGLEPMPPCICSSVGFLIEDNEDYKTIASSLSADQVLGRLTIPVSCIQNITILTQTK